MPSPLFIDLYQGDNPAPDWGRVWQNKSYAGAIIKATEGLYYPSPNNTWFRTNWDAIKHFGAYGTKWFRGAYHFLKFNQDGAKQADFYLKAVEGAGGWDVGDLWPIVDVEMGGERNSNHNATKEQVEECVEAFVAKIKRSHGRDVMLYGNGAMRDLGITSKMGCKYLWCPRYTTTLPPYIYRRAGWETTDLWGWQYCGDGTAYLEGYPKVTPIGKEDITVLTFPGGLEGMRSKLWAENPNSLGANHGN